MSGRKKLFSTQTASLPKPYFVVFYNGTDEQPERLLLKLSALYETGDGEERIRIMDEQPELELKTLVININRGYNEELKQSCRDLYGYMVYVDKVREFTKIYPRETAVKMAIAYCIENDILAEFLAARRAEVMSMSIFEYDQEEHLRQVAEENQALGWAKGHREGKIAGILDLLAELGPIPDEILQRIQSQKDLAVLTGWLKAAAKSKSMDDFVRRM